jgi:hypothetical protein
MARMDYSFTVTRDWVKNPIQKIVKNTYIDIDGDVIVQSLPTGKMLEISYFPKTKTFKFSPDSQKEGNANSAVGEYLQKFIYNKLLDIVATLFNQEIHFYGFVGKSGFYGFDIYVNDNWLDWNLVEALYKEAKIKTPDTIFVGKLKEYNTNPIDNFIIRSSFELPDRRSIYYFKSN